MTRNTKLKLGLTTLMAAIIAAPLAFAQGEGSGEAVEGMEGMEGMMGQGGDMSGMMGMMQMMQACTEMMQAMTDQMNAAPEAPSGQDDQG